MIKVVSSSPDRRWSIHLFLPHLLLINSSFHPVPSTCLSTSISLWHRGSQITFIQAPHLAFTSSPCPWSIPLPTSSLIAFVRLRLASGQEPLLLSLVTVGKLASLRDLLPGVLICHLDFLSFGLDLLIWPWDPGIDLVIWLLLSKPDSNTTFESDSKKMV